MREIPAKGTGRLTVIGLCFVRRLICIRAQTALYPPHGGMMPSNRSTYTFTFKSQNVVNPVEPAIVADHHRASGIINKASSSARNIINIQIVGCSSSSGTFALISASVYTRLRSPSCPTFFADLHLKLNRLT